MASSDEEGEIAAQRVTNDHFVDEKGDADIMTSSDEEGEIAAPSVTHDHFVDEKGDPDIMASSDEEGEIVAQSVTNDHFVDEKSDPDIMASSDEEGEIVAQSVRNDHFVDEKGDTDIMTSSDEEYEIAAQSATNDQFVDEKGDPDIMASSDEEGEVAAQSVTNYHFEDEKGDPVSFSVLPVLWGEGEKQESIESPVFLNGIADDGIQKIYKQVTAWKIENLGVHPEVSVLSKEMNWIKLLNPRKCFEDTVRTILITVRCLHFVKKYPETLGNTLWGQLWKIFSCYEVRPCENDLLNHLSLIRQAVKHDETLLRSQFLATFLENPMESIVCDEDSHARLDVKKNTCMVPDEEDVDVCTWDEGGGDAGDRSDDEIEPFDYVCAFCDNGGDLICCEGRCLRSFHATVDDGWDSDCQSLNFSVTQLKTMQNFLCENCQQKKHQCFACGKLGGSDKSSDAEVFQCISATCGYFYHPDCVAKMLHPEDESEAEEVRKNIAGGEAFTCPVHKCHICKQGENKDDSELQFAVCRRCPKSYHRKCLPRKIVFEDLEEEGIMQMAWNDLLPNNRALIYCLKHKMDKNLKTPIRNHIQFPPSIVTDKKRRLAELAEKKKAVVERRSGDAEHSSSGIFKVPKKSFFDDVKESGSVIERGKSKKPEAVKPFKYSLRKDKERTSILREFENARWRKETPAVDKGRAPFRKEHFLHSETFNSRQSSICEEVPKRPPFRKDHFLHSETFSSRHSSAIPKRPLFRKKQEVDDATKKRIEAIMKDPKHLVTVEEIMRGHKVSSIYAESSSKTMVDKNITLGKVEGSVEAVRSADKTLKKGGTIDDAKAVCAPEVLNHIIRWRNKLTVYLSPFIYGNRYSSFGRHFTKLDKLKEIVDKLHWYAQNGDMIVDFCCGANDFSLLMKQKLEETGKQCSYRNFDIIHPKNDFCFEKRDWMTVRPKELPVGANLIMGLNPPFGVKASLANRFIDKALEFKPKILILIVPPETQRLDRKKNPYNLIWEDRRKFSGKSFYLPGSVDVNNNQIEQWNNTPPVLYLWSRSDWTKKHKEIALEHYHISKQQTSMKLSENYSEECLNHCQSGSFLSEGVQNAGCVPTTTHEFQGWTPDFSYSNELRRQDTGLGPDSSYGRVNSYEFQGWAPDSSYGSELQRQDAGLASDSSFGRVNSSATHHNPPSHDQNYSSMYSFTHQIPPLPPQGTGMFNQIPPPRPPQGTGMLNCMGFP